MKLQRLYSVSPINAALHADGLPSFDDVLAAADRLKGIAVRTPLLNSPKVDVRLGFRLLLKAESLQNTGSFKFRGACNALVRLTPLQRRAGVVSYSSGNHAQGVAAAANLLGIAATVVMPSDVPAIEAEKTRSYDVEVVFYDRYKEDSVAIARKIVAETGGCRGAFLRRPEHHRQTGYSRTGNRGAGTGDGLRPRRGHHVLQRWGPFVRLCYCAFVGMPWHRAL